jgi:outer membrane translocation and assembly module TamA
VKGFKTTLFAVIISGLSYVQADALKPAAWVPLPAIGSSPETGLQYGAYVMRIYPQTAVNVPQNRLEVLLQGTTQGQFQAYAWPNLYVQDGQWQVKGKLGGKYWPADYFGQSNSNSESRDQFADTAIESSVTVNRQMTDTVKLGASLFAEWHEIDLIDDQATLLNDSTPGYQGGLYSGVGLIASSDTRNNLDWPSQGQLISAQWDIFTKALASDVSFNILHINTAQYIKMKDNVFAIGFGIAQASENTPFTHLPRPSGSSTLRGANGNQWIDQSSAGIQTDYRKVLTRKWAVVGFLDAFQVAPNLSQLEISEFHTSLGGGIRFGMTPDRFNVRVDLGWVDFESIGFTISVGEAF